MMKMDEGGEKENRDPVGEMRAYIAHMELPALEKVPPVFKVGGEQISPGAFGVEDYLRLGRLERAAREGQDEEVENLCQELLKRGISELWGEDFQDAQLAWGAVMTSSDESVRKRVLAAHLLARLDSEEKRWRVLAALFLLANRRRRSKEE